MGKEVKTEKNHYQSSKPNEKCTKDHYAENTKNKMKESNPSYNRKNDDYDITKELNPINYSHDQNKFISNASEKNFEFYELSKGKPRKNSKDSEGFSTSNEEHQEKENEKKAKKKVKKANKFCKEYKKNKEPYKTNALDFKKKYKTELCKNFEINGYCKYGENCAYAHGKENLRLKVTNTEFYRTKKCTQFFEKGYCPYGNRCQFAHQLQSNIINNPFDKKMSYSKILETLSNIEAIGNIKNIIKKPRLQVFKDIVQTNENIPSRLLNDIKQLA